MQIVSDNGAIQNQVRVLLVDDDQSMHEMLDLSLDKTQYDVAHATDASEAMTVIAHQPPDIVITDAMMPGQSGFSLITSLKSDPRTSDIPVILWTVLEGMDGNVMDSSGQADLTMSKPFNLFDLEDKLNRAKRLIDRHAKVA
ncbi:MAG: response regulator [Blastocatellia bacterium]|nr:response regulator [Blastocatellia bacterium]